MTDPLNRFLEAQEGDYQQALTEIKAGRKRSHWMWYIFPQMTGLGYSETSRFYAIKSREEARAYLDHPVLGERLREITAEVLSLDETDAYNIFGSPDDLKLKSCMTLFSMVAVEENNLFHLFHKVIEKYFDGEFDEETIRLMKGREEPDH